MERNNLVPIPTLPKGMCGQPSSLLVSIWRGCTRQEKTSNLYEVNISLKSFTNQIPNYFLQNASPFDQTSMRSQQLRLGESRQILCCRYIRCSNRERFLNPRRQAIRRGKSFAHLYLSIQKMYHMRFSNMIYVLTTTAMDGNSPLEPIQRPPHKTNSPRPPRRQPSPSFNRNIRKIRAEAPIPLQSPLHWQSTQHPSPPKQEARRTTPRSRQQKLPR